MYGDPVLIPRVIVEINVNAILTLYWFDSVCEVKTAVKLCFIEQLSISCTVNAEKYLEREIFFSIDHALG